MKKEEQTPELLVELCKLTVMFTRKLQPRYYYQYRGEAYDLAMEFYCEFLTPKGRGEKKETLLDKFDPEVTSLAYLVKVSVTRKLIDRSRADKSDIVSIDRLVDEYGDLITKVFNLVERPDDEELMADEFFKRRLVQSYEKLDEFTRNSIYAKLYDVASQFCEVLRPSFMYVHGCPVQQITDKTVVLFVPDLHRCINFALDDGHPRGKVRPFVIDTKGLVQYHSGFERELFEEFHNSTL